MNNRLINTKVAGGGGGCTDIVDNYDPFDGNGVALYQLNGNALDSSPNAYNGTWSGTEAYGTGVFGQAGIFNGSTSKITLTASATTPIDLSTDNFTISFWIKGTTNASYGALISKYGTNNPSRSLYSYRFTGGTITFGLVSTGGVFSTVTSNGVNPVNQWTHVVFVRNSTTQSIYLDGAFDNSISNTTTTNSIAQPLLVGDTDDNVADEFFEGSIDQIRFFDTALDPLEIEALYTEELCICDGTVDTLDILGDGSCVATYQLDGNANDLSGQYSGDDIDVSYGVGEFDLAGVFNGASSYVDLPSIVSSKVSLTVSAWFKSTGTEGTIYVDWNSDKNIHIQLVSGNISVSTYYGTTALNFTSPLTYNDGQWHQVVVANDIIANTRNTWVDNQLIENNATLPSGTFSHAQYMAIGAQDVAGSFVSFFNGSIDQVRIFNKALNSTEVETLWLENACTYGGRQSEGTQILGDTSCIAYYKLDGTAADETGTYDGTFTTPNYGNGEFLYAGVFNGVDSRIQIASSATAPLNVSSGNFSISMWVNLSNLTNNNKLFYKWGGSSGTRNFLSTVTTDGYLYVVEGTTVGDTLMLGTTAVPTNTWVHIAISRTQGGNLVQYINGVPTDTFSTLGRTLKTSTEPLYMGYQAGQTTNFTGLIDQVRLFDKPISPSEVATLYNEGI